MIKEIAVGDTLANLVEEELNSSHINWNYYKDTNYFYNDTTDENRKILDRIEKEYGPIDDRQRFTHTIYHEKWDFSFDFMRESVDSPFMKNFKFLPILIDELKDTFIGNSYSIYRAMINRNLICPSWSLHAVHPDSWSNGRLSLLYYVDDSDGDTYFFNKDRCIKKTKPVKGTGVVFPSEVWHAGASPTKTDTRTVINIMFERKPEL